MKFKTAIPPFKQRKRMKFIHWFSLATCLIWLGLHFIGFPTAGWVILVGATVIELVYSAVTGKKTNDGTH